MNKRAIGAARRGVGGGCTDKKMGRWHERGGVEEGGRAAGRGRLWEGGGLSRGRVVLRVICAPQRCLRCACGRVGCGRVVVTQRFCGLGEERLRCASGVLASPALAIASGMRIATVGRWCTW